MAPANCRGTLGLPLPDGFLRLFPIRGAKGLPNFLPLEVSVNPDRAPASPIFPAFTSVRTGLSVAPIGGKHGGSLHDTQPAVNPLEHVRGNPQCRVRSFPAARRRGAYHQHAGLALENLPDAIRAQVPKLSNFCRRVMPLNGRRRGRFGGCINRTYPLGAYQFHLGGSCERIVPPFERTPGSIRDPAHHAFTAGRREWPYLPLSKPEARNHPRHLRRTLCGIATNADGPSCNISGRTVPELAMWPCRGIIGFLHVFRLIPKSGTLAFLGFFLRHAGFAG